MADIHNAQRKEVNVEDLLRLKRAERPDEAFWNNFDRELHQRMLQTLVKKDPWYIQLLRGVSGRIAQTTAVGAAAAFLVLMVVRPAFLADSYSNQSPVIAGSSVQTVPNSTQANSTQANSTQVLVATDLRIDLNFDGSLDRDLNARLARDYQMEAIPTRSVAEGTGYTADYSLDSIELADFDSLAYVSDSVSFAGTGLATALVY
jgi:hypothetical protein